jgi:hypothetical protein
MMSVNGGWPEPVDCQPALPEYGRLRRRWRRQYPSPSGLIGLLLKHRLVSPVYCCFAGHGGSSEGSQLVERRKSVYVVSLIQQCEANGFSVLSVDLLECGF